jgi:hypothetical protein
MIFVTGKKSYRLRCGFADAKPKAYAYDAVLLTQNPEEENLCTKLIN